MQDGHHLQHDLQHQDQSVQGEDRNLRDYGLDQTVSYPHQRKGDQAGGRGDVRCGRVHQLATANQAIVRVKTAKMPRQERQDLLQSDRHPQGGDKPGRHQPKLLHKHSSIQRGPHPVFHREEVLTQQDSKII